MNITLSGTKVSMDGHTLAFQKNNLVDSMVITVDTDETWQYKLDVKYPCKDSNGKELYNVIDLTRVGNTCTAILQATMLPFNGKYTMQLRGVSGDKVYHTDTFDVWVKYSIDPGKVYDPVPSEFYQIEQTVTEQAANAKQSATESAESATNAAASATKAENAVVHSPIIGENGNWFIWDFEKSEYVDSGKSASTPPITPDTAGKYLTNDGSKAEWGVPSGGSDLSLGITSAQVGQIAKITAVDTNGKPTEWSPVDMAGSGVEWYEVIDTETTEAVNDLIISTDKNGRPISGYHALAMVLCLMISADSTQTSGNGNIWVYPMSDNNLSSGVRTVITVSGWKTITRPFNFLYAGSNHAIFVSGAPAGNTFDGTYNNVFDGIRLYINNAGDHLPTGTKVRCLLLSKGWEA